MCAVSARHKRVASALLPRRAKMRAQRIALSRAFATLMPCPVYTLAAHHAHVAAQCAARCAVLAAFFAELPAFHYHVLRHRSEAARHCHQRYLSPRLPTPPPYAAFPACSAEPPTTFARRRR